MVVGSTYSLDVELQGKSVPAVLDSGSERTLMSKATADMAGNFYMRGKDSLFVRDGLVYRQSAQSREPQIIVPESMQARIIRLAHNIPMSAHFGVKRTLHQITRHYYWYNLKVTVRDNCRGCVGCARVKRPNRPHREGVGNVPVIGEPFAQWSADILGPLPLSDAF